MAMRLMARPGVEWLTTTLGGSASLVGAITWAGDHGVIAGLTTLLGALTVVVGLIFRTLFQQIAELRATEAEWRRRDVEWRKRETEWRAEREQWHAERSELEDRVNHLEAVIARAGLDPTAP